MAPTTRKRKSREEEKEQSDAEIEQEEEEDASSDEEADEEAEDSGDSDYDASKKQSAGRRRSSTTKRARKVPATTAAKAKRSRGTSKQSSGATKLRTAVPSARRSRAARAKKKDAEEGAHTSDSDAEATTKSLFQLVRSSSPAISSHIDEWLELYSNEPTQATAQVCTLVLQASGCKSEMFESDVIDLFGEKNEEEDEEGDDDEEEEEGQQTEKSKKREAVEALLEKFKGRFPKEAGDRYPLLESKKLSTSLLNFLGLLFAKSKETTKFMNSFLPTLVRFLTTLSASQIRAFRHTASFLSYGIVAELIAVIVEWRKELARVQGKKQAKKAAQDIEAKLEKAKEEIHAIVQNIFAHRYRDLSPELRALSIASLAQWIHDLPDEFLKDEHLKYIAWSLYDRDAKVRSQTLHALGPLYTESVSSTVFASGIEKFTSRFSSRVIEIATLDEDVATAQEAAKVCTTMMSAGTKLSESDELKLLSLIFDENKSLRIAAAAFFSEVFEKKMAEKAAIPKKKRKQTKKAAKGKRAARSKKSSSDVEDEDARDKPLSLWTVLRFFTDFFEEMPSLSVYLEETLWDHKSIGPLFRDFEGMTSLLLRDEDEEDEDEDEQNDDEQLDPATRELIVIRLINASARRAVGRLETTTSKLDNGRLPKSKGKKKAGMAKTAKTAASKEATIVTVAGDAVPELIEPMTAHLAEALPQLLAKYNADLHKVTELVELPQFFDLEVYVTHRLQHHFEELLKQLRDLFSKQVDRIALSACVLTFKHMLTAQLALKSIAQKTIDTLTMELLSKLQSELKTLQSEHSRSKSNQKSLSAAAFSLRMCLIRLREMVMSLDLGQMQIFKDVSQVLENYVNSTQTLDRQAASAAISILHAHLMWRLRAFSSSDLTAVDRDQLAKDCSSFTQQLIRLLSIEDEEGEEDEQDKEEDEEEDEENGEQKKEQRPRDVKLEGFYALSDLVIAFRPNATTDTATEDTTLAPQTVSLKLSGADKIRMIDFFDDAMARLERQCDELAVDRDKAKGKNKVPFDRRIEAIRAQQQILAISLAKCFSYDVFDSSNAHELLAHYVQHGKLVSEAIRHMFQTLRQKKPSSEWELEFKALRKLFSRYSDETVSDKREAALVQFVELGKRLAKSHFKLTDKHPENIPTLIRNSIEFAFDDIKGHAVFLSGIFDHAKRLNKDDAASILRELDAQVESHQDEVDQEDQAAETFTKLHDVLHSMVEGNKRESAAQTTHDSDAEMAD